MHKLFLGKMLTRLDLMSLRLFWLLIEVFISSNTFADIQLFQRVPYDDNLWLLQCIEMKCCFTLAFQTIRLCFQILEISKVFFRTKGISLNS
jgi:hypothetical protein